MPGPNPNSRKLNPGDRIRVIGWPMLSGLEDGRTYRVAYVSYIRGNPYYGFRLNRGRKIIARHFCAHVDPWVHDYDDLNKIEVL